eukprot:6305776-Amphidinium_carterae.1
MPHEQLLGVCQQKLTCGMSMGARSLVNSFEQGRSKPMSKSSKQRFGLLRRRAFSPRFPKEEQAEDFKAEGCLKPIVPTLLEVCTVNTKACNARHAC